MHNLSWSVIYDTISGAMPPRGETGGRDMHFEYRNLNSMSQKFKTKWQLETRVVPMMVRINLYYFLANSGTMYFLS